MVLSPKVMRIPGGFCEPCYLGMGKQSRPWRGTCGIFVSWMNTAKRFLGTIAAIRRRPYSDRVDHTFWPLASHRQVPLQTPRRPDSGTSLISTAVYLAYCGKQ
eukprot:jgi/Botrbrau1/13690/Bobra.0378s0019.1